MRIKAPKKWYIYGPTGGNIKCDKLGCDYRLQINANDLESYLFINCPKCGSPLLTEADWNTTCIINMIVGHPIIRFINWFGSTILRMKKTKYKIKMNGTGTIDMEKMSG